MTQIKARYALSALLVLLPINIHAAAECKQIIAKIESLQGQVDVQLAGTTEWQAAGQTESFCPGDKIRTSKQSRATIVLNNESLVSIDQSTTLIFPGPEKKSARWFLELLKGSAFFRSRVTKNLNIQTPFINAAHEGTEFLVNVTGEQAIISVFDGSVSAQNKMGKVLVKNNFSATAQKDRAPELNPLSIKLAEAVEWSLFYPPIIDYQALSQASADPNLNKALQLYSQGNPVAALTVLNSMPVSGQSEDILVIKAGLLLTIGRVDQAEPILQKLLTSRQRSYALALQSIIALTKTKADEAKALAMQAIATEQNSATAHIALSFVHQAFFDIEHALRETQSAVELAPDNALAWARLAELQLASGDSEQAQKSAHKAQVLNPNLARTQIISGFAELASTHTNQGKTSFEQAIKLDSSDPLARLGLGLAKIRQGDVELGTKDMETAANLDPNNSIIRSYLGKAYYEQRNKEFSETELGLAKNLDPKDPTPWFYDAILKQTTNRPVEALHDMQEAIKLNDNRGVYRSSLLLDKDLAARSAAQGRIYNELGYQQLGLFEGWKSVNKDYNNYSGHRLLADNYAALPRHELARVSELLQSQLLQPINITPIQPNLAESNVFILNGLGPSDFSYNEFNPLFEYNRVALQASGLYGGNNTWGDNVAVSGLNNNISFSLGQFHYETDGFRDNNFLKKDTYNAFVQSKITDKLNLQAEYRHEERDNGDLSINFDPNNIARDFNEKRSVDSYRLGGRYEFTPQSSLIGSLIYQEVRIRQRNVESLELFPDFFFSFDQEIRNRRSGFISELQHSYVHSGFSMVNGFGHIDQASKSTTTDLGTFTDNIDLTRTNIYNYSKLYLSKHLTATLGLSFDFYELGTTEINPVNPKLGIEWSPWESTTFRMAGFRSSSISRVANQTIEPTQVAGFNQLYDDSEGTVFWRYGLGVDHKFSKQLTSGLEYSERLLYMTGGAHGVERSEQSGRAYVYLTPTEQLALALEYYYEQIHQNFPDISYANAQNEGLFDSVATHRLPLTLSFFHPSGLSFKIKNTFVHQSGLFQNLEKVSLEQGKSDFFTVDLNLSYRFPKRYGIISFGINNLFDDHIHYQNTNYNENILAPGRILFTRMTLAF